MKLINLLIRELDNCSLGGDFRVMCHAKICQFDRFSLATNLKEHVVVIKELPDWVQVKNTLYQCLKPLGAQGIMAKSSKIGSDLLYRICPL